MPQQERMPVGCENLAPDEIAKLTPDEIDALGKRYANIIERVRAHDQKIGVEPTPERLEADWEFVRDFRKSAVPTRLIRTVFRRLKQ